MIDEIIDKKLGEFIRRARLIANLTIDQVEVVTGIPNVRLRSLELGISNIGITINECRALAPLYRIDLDEMIAVAVGEQDDEPDAQAEAIH